jgi:membrane fusion protein, multidrug efflux system
LIHTLTRSALILVPALAVLLTPGCQSPKTAAAGTPPPVPVTVSSASTVSAPLEVRVVGVVEPSAKVEIKSQIAGQLMRVNFTEGQDVHQGDLLFEIDPRPYREALLQAEGAVERDKAQLNQANFALQKDVVQSQSAEADAARMAALFNDKLISDQQNLQFKTSAGALKQSLLGDQAAIESARASQHADEAMVAKAKLDLADCEIRAPISGRAGNVLVQAGNLVKVDDVALVVINRITPVFVSFNVPDSQLSAIRRFSALRTLPVEAVPRNDASSKAFGSLIVVDNTVDTQTGTIHLKATFDNTDRVLWPGQFVDATLTLDRSGTATVVPSEAVQPGQNGQLVYVVKPDHTVEPRTVSVGRTLGRNVIVEKGISPGESVVTDGQMLLFPGAHVAVAAAPKGDAGL